MYDEKQRLCKNISYLRKTHDLSKKEMAQLLGISISALNRIEQGELPSRLSISILFRIQTHFRVSPFEELEE